MNIVVAEIWFCLFGLFVSPEEDLHQSITNSSLTVASCNLFCQYYLVAFFFGSCTYVHYVPINKMITMSQPSVYGCIQCICVCVCVYVLVCVCPHVPTLSVWVYTVCLCVCVCMCVLVHACVMCVWVWVSPSPNLFGLGVYIVFMCVRVCMHVWCVCVGACVHTYI